MNIELLADAYSAGVGDSLLKKLDFEMISMNEIRRKLEEIELKMRNNFASNNCCHCCFIIFVFSHDNDN